MHDRVVRRRDDIPEAVILETGAIRFRHYLISVHAIDRFQQRTNGSVPDLIEALNDAVLAISGRSHHVGLRRALKRNDDAGGYTLKHGNAFFFVRIDPAHDYHVIATIMTTWTMVRSYAQKRACSTHTREVSSFLSKPIGEIA